MRLYLPPPPPPEIDINAETENEIHLQSIHMDEGKNPTASLNDHLGDMEKPKPHFVLAYNVL